MKQISKNVACKCYKIRVLSGGTEKQEYHINKPEIIIGRFSNSDIQVVDKSISRRHCKCVFDGQQWYLEDLNTTNGTWLMGRAIAKRTILPVYTPFRAGDALFELCLITKRHIEPRSEGSVICHIDPLTLNISYVNGQAISSGSSFPGSKLISINKFQNLISGLKDNSESYLKLLNGFYQVTQFGKGYIYVYNLETGKLQPETGLSRDGVITNIPLETVNHEIINYIVEKRTAIYAMSNSDSTVHGKNSPFKGIICLPLVGKKQLNGLIYLHIDPDEVSITEEHLKLLAFLGHSAGMALEYQRVLMFNAKNERIFTTGMTAAEISHYIKNLLFSLDGSMNLLQKGHESKNLDLVGEAWNILSINHRKLGNLVTGILNIATNQKIKLKNCDVGLVLKNVYDLVKSQFEYSGIIVALKVSEKACFPANVDPDGIYRVLLNLLTNAEHSVLSKREEDPEFTGEISLCADYDESGKKLLISVDDNGVGMNDTELKSIFDLFSSSKGATGNGLGLHVCKRIIDAHGGTIRASAKKGKGCKFTISLPILNDSTNTITALFY